MIKLVGLSLFASVIANVVGDTATLIAALAAGVAGTAYIGTQLARLLRDALRLTRRILATYEVLAELGDWMPAVDERLDGLEAASAAASEPAKALARELGVEHRQQPAA